MTMWCGDSCQPRGKTRWEGTRGSPRGPLAPHCSLFMCFVFSTAINRSSAAAATSQFEHQLWRAACRGAGRGCWKGVAARPRGIARRMAHISCAAKHGGRVSSAALCRAAVCAAFCFPSRQRAELHGRGRDPPATRDAPPALGRAAGARTRDTATLHQKKRCHRVPPPSARSTSTPTTTLSTGGGAAPR